MTKDWLLWVSVARFWAYLRSLNAGGPEEKPIPRVDRRGNGDGVT